MHFFRKRKNERRAAYRVDASARHGKVWLALEEGPTEGAIENINVRGCAVTALVAATRSVRVGQSIKLRVDIEGAGLPRIYVRGAVRSLEPLSDAVHRIGLEFEEPKTLLAQLRDPHWRYFNRRSAFRVAPIGAGGKRETARFVYPGCGRAVTLPLHDISSSGLSVSLRTRDEVDFPDGELIRIRFRLPANPLPFDIKAQLVHRTAVGDRVRVGFRYDMNWTRDAEDQCDAIAEYVMNLQRKAVTHA